jgi:hypothetical protein
MRDIETIDAELRGVWLATLNGCPPSNRAHRTSCSTSERQRSRLWAETEHLREPDVRDIDAIDAELRLLVRAWRVARVLSDRIPSTAHIDELLDERAAALSPLRGNGNI